MIFAAISYCRSLMPLIAAVMPTYARYIDAAAITLICFALALVYAIAMPFADAAAAYAVFRHYADALLMLR